LKCLFTFSERSIWILIFSIFIVFSTSDLCAQSQYLKYSFPQSNVEVVGEMKHFSFAIIFFALSFLTYASFGKLSNDITDDQGEEESVLNYANLENPFRIQVPISRIS